MSVFFNPAAYTDEELVAKQQELSAKLLVASQTGQTQAVNQMQAIIEQISFERMERIALSGLPHARENAVVMETDPALRQRSEPAEQKTDTTRKRTRFGSRPAFPKPTATPTADFNAAHSKPGSNDE